MYAWIHPALYHSTAGIAVHKVGIIHDSFNFKLCKAIQQGRFDPLATQFCSVIDLQSLLYILSISVTHLLLMTVHVLQIREEIKQFGINIYQFPECDSDEDEDFKTQEQILKVPHFIHKLSWLKCVVWSILRLTVYFGLGFFLCCRCCCCCFLAEQYPICCDWE